MANPQAQLAELTSHKVQLRGYAATDNAYAERINGIIKNEYLNRWTISDLQDLKRKTRKAVHH